MVKEIQNKKVRPHQRTLYLYVRESSHRAIVCDLPKTQLEESTAVHGMIGPVGKLETALVGAGEDQIGSSVVESNTAVNIASFLGSQSLDNETTHDKGQVVSGREASRRQLNVFQVVSDSLVTIGSSGSESTTSENNRSLLLRG